MWPEPYDSLLDDSTSIELFRDQEAVARVSLNFLMSLTAFSRRVILAIGASLLALSCAELGLRALGFRPVHEVYSKPSALWRSDPVLGWSHTPFAADRFVGPRPWPIEFDTEVLINSIGLRGPEVLSESRPEITILVLGDSMVAAFEVPIRETFTAHLGQLLEMASGRTVEAINAGVRGYGTDQSFLYFKHRGMSLKPDLVLLFHSSNDFRNNITLHRARRPFSKPAFGLKGPERESLVLHPLATHDICSHVILDPSLSVVRQDKLPSRLLCRAQILFLDQLALSSLTTLALRRFPTALRAVHNLGAPRGSRQVTLPQAHVRALTSEILAALATSVFDSTGRRLLVVGSSSDITALDSMRLGGKVLFVRYDQEQPGLQYEPRFRFKNDGHFNSAGHRQIAQILASRILQEYSSLFDTTAR